MTLAEKIIEFNSSLQFDGSLPPDIRIMNPFSENPEALKTSSIFYRKFYNDNSFRKIILGINPGRFGAGVTGIPFTDTQRLTEKCMIDLPGIVTRELSSIFVYDVIAAFGGAEKFYSDFYFGAVCPLGFVKLNDKGKEVNYNYYDSADLQKSVEPFIITSLERQLNWEIDRNVCFCLGNNKNFNYLQKLNKRKGYFKQIVPLEHPRFIMQYRLKEKEKYIDKYLSQLNANY